MTGIYKKGFSLSEILVAIAVLGILAAITIPNLIKREQNKVNVVKLLKFYSTLEQAHTYAVIFNGPSSSWTIKNANENSLKEIASYYEPYFSITKKCSGNRECWNQQTYNLPGTVGFAYDNMVSQKAQNISYKLADGTNVLIDFYNNNDYGFDSNNILYPIIVFLVDLNGEKKPNRLGRDIFIFAVGKDDQIMPSGIRNCKSKSTLGCRTSEVGGISGYSCTCKVINEKAIKY